MNKTKRCEACEVGVCLNENHSIETKLPHSPTPWQRGTLDDKLFNDDNRKANQALVYRAVNAHEELVAFVKDVLRVANDGMLTPEWIKVSKKLIAKAEGK